jgi:uncharacterized protein YaaW (UPF0174 family)
VKLSQCFTDWSQEDRDNLAAILKMRGGLASPEELQEGFWGAYNNWARSAVKSGAKNAWGLVAGAITKSPSEKVSGRETWQEPSYEEVLVAACKIVKAEEKGASVADQEVHLVHKLFVQCLFNMTPSARKNFFEAEVDLKEVAADAKIGVNIKGQVAAFSAISAAQASGFGVYLLATTTLGALTHAVGITLPFLVYMGLTKAISIAIGPIGWAGLGLSMFWKLTGPDWKRLLPALVYIITVKHRPREEPSA